MTLLCNDHHEVKRSHENKQVQQVHTTHPQRITQGPACRLQVLSWSQICFCTQQRHSQKFTYFAHLPSKPQKTYLLPVPFATVKIAIIIIAKITMSHHIPEQAFLIQSEYNFHPNQLKSTYTNTHRDTQPQILSKSVAKKARFSNE